MTLFRVGAGGIFMQCVNVMFLKENTDCIPNIRTHCNGRGRFMCRIFGTLGFTVARQPVSRVNPDAPANFQDNVFASRNILSKQALPAHISFSFLHFTYCRGYFCPEVGGSRDWGRRGLSDKVAWKLNN